MRTFFQLNTITDSAGIKSTCHVLADINEKIIAAIALKNIHNTYQDLVDDGIQNVVQTRNEHPSGSLTAQDLFYVKISRVHELFKVFLDYTDEQVQKKQNQSGISSTLADIGTIVMVGIIHYHYYI